MTDFDAALKDAASAILKRELTDGERAELRELAGTIGMGSVEDYLYMLMVFKRSEDRIKAGLASFEDSLGKRFDEISVLEKRMESSIENAAEKILRERAGDIGRDIGMSVIEGAKELLGANGEYQFLRGQVWIICLMSLTASLSYWLGSANVIRGGGMGPLEILLMLPSGWLALICSSMYAYMWVWDHWGLVKSSIRYKLIFASQTLLIFCLAGFLLNG
jgi:hypothetical protein